jgi:hypothetical protein
VCARVYIDVSICNMHRRVAVPMRPAAPLPRSRVLSSVLHVDDYTPARLGRPAPPFTTEPLRRCEHQLLFQNLPKIEKRTDPGLEDAARSLPAGAAAALACADVGYCHTDRSSLGAAQIHTSSQPHQRQRAFVVLGRTCCANACEDIVCRACSSACPCSINLSN